MNGVDSSYWQKARDFDLNWWSGNMSKLEYKRAYEGAWNVETDGTYFMGGWISPKKTYGIENYGFFIPGSLIMEEDYDGKTILYAYDKYGNEVFQGEGQISFSLKEEEKEMGLVEDYDFAFNFDADCVTVHLIGEPKSNIPEKIIFNGVTTVCIFPDGEKVISRPSKHDRFDKEFGVMACIAKRVYGSRQAFLKAIENAYDQNDL